MDGAEVAMAALMLAGMLGLWMVLMVKGRREHCDRPPPTDPFRLG